MEELKKELNYYIERVEIYGDLPSLDMLKDTKKLVDDYEDTCEDSHIDIGEIQEKIDNSISSLHNIESDLDDIKASL